MKPPPPPPMISVLRNSHDCVGFLRSAGPRGFTAYNADGQLLGLFRDKQTAVVLLGLFRDKQTAVEAITAAST